MGKIPAVRVGERNFLVQPEAIKTALAAGVVGERISKRQKRNGNGKRKAAKEATKSA